MPFDKYDTRSTTEALVSRMLSELYPDLKFETNARIAGFRPDFYFPDHKAVLEADGSVHESFEAQERDREKDERYRKHGLMVFRLRNVDIWNDIHAAIHVIASTLGIFHPDEDQEQVWKRFGRRRTKQDGASKYRPRPQFAS